MDVIEAVWQKAKAQAETAMPRPKPLKPVPKIDLEAKSYDISA